MDISCNFDSGNIKVINLSDPQDIQLEIIKDNQSDFYQWFHFRVSNAPLSPLKLKIMNAGGAAYANGWENYRACVSYDRETWFRTDCEYDGQVLTIHHTPENSALYFAYFAPYSMERHHDLIAQSMESSLVKHTLLGHTIDGQDMDLLEISADDDNANKLKCWFIARQHPGESMAEWWMEGFLNRLLDQSDPVSRKLLELCVFYVVPNMNPDGSRRGHLRTNAVGSNLNREWNCSNMEKSPEVHLVLKAMNERGMDFNIDVHGDENLPYNFIAGFEGIPNLNPKNLTLLNAYKEALKKRTPDFQTTIGYPIDAAGTGNLSMSTNYLAETFQCPAMTLEMPFKDNDEMPDEYMGWSPDRCGHLARACLEALLDIVPQLKRQK